MSDEGVFAVTALIVKPNERLVLAVSRKDDPNDFGLPGGKIEPGETPEMALRRELIEETGLEPFRIEAVYDRSDAPPDNSKLCRCFHVPLWLGSIKTREKGVVKWVPYEEITHGTFGSYNTGLMKACADIFEGKKRYAESEQ